MFCSKIYRNMKGVCTQTDYEHKIAKFWLKNKELVNIVSTLVGIGQQRLKLINQIAIYKLIDCVCSLLKVLRIKGAAGL